MLLNLQLDGPSQIRCDAGVDTNHNDTLEPNESHFGGQFPLGRVSRLQCAASTKPPEIRLVTKMSDITIPLNLTGYAGAQTIIVLAVAGNQKTEQHMKVFLLRDAPTVHILSPSETESVPKGKPLTVAIQVDRDCSAAIDRVEFGFDLNENGLLDAGRWSSR